MSEMTEKRQRSFEELRTKADYFEEINSLAALASELAGANDKTVKCIEEVIQLVMQAFKKKEKYVLAISSKWRRRQGLFSKIRDTLIERQENKRLKQELENEKLIKELESYRNKVGTNVEPQVEESQGVDVNSFSLAVKSSTDVPVEDSSSGTDVLEF